MRDVWDDMMRMQEEMDRMFDDFFRVRRPLLAGPKEKGVKGVKGEKTPAKVKPFRAPVCNITETEKNVLATFEVPGAEKGDIDVNVTEDSIEVKADRKVEKESRKDEKGYFSYMASASKFYRRMPLPAKVDPDKSLAVCKDGVLKVTMPKVAPKPKKKGRKIDIK